MSIEQIIFIVLILLAVGVFLRNAIIIRKNIRLGRKNPPVDQKGKRFKNMVLFALGQKKMFKRPLVALLHFVVYAGFLIVNIEILEIVLDGALGKHRIFAPYLGSFYPIVLNVFETFAVGVIVVCVIFLIRRNIIKVKRFHKPEMKKWPKLDGNIILFFEIFLMMALLKMNAADTAMGNPYTQDLFFSGFLASAFSGMDTEFLHIVERGAWWFHIVGICFFANYVLYSKHLHIFLAFPNSYYGKLESKGKMENMDSVTKEVKIMLSLEQPDPNAPTEISRFGAKDITDLKRKNLLDAFTCTECGRCTDNCPANMTGRTLSPRKIVMDVRDRTEELGKHKRKNGADAEDGKSLLGDYISEEEINACTSCNACVEACPVSIDPLDVILQLRRYKVMEEAQGPTEWNNMYQNLETSFSPWKFPPTDRFKWSQGIGDSLDTSSTQTENQDEQG